MWVIMTITFIIGKIIAKKQKKFIQPNQTAFNEAFDELLVHYYQSNFSNANEIEFIKKGYMTTKATFTS